MTLSAGFDFSWNEVAFAVVKDGVTLFDRQLALSGRDASKLPCWLLENLSEFKLDFNSIEEWTVGSGPGSFSGMRIAASFVDGLCFNRDAIRRRSMPTACALAFPFMEKHKEVKRAVALFDGRKKDALAFPMIRRDNGAIAATSSGMVMEKPDEALLPEDALLVALSKDRVALTSFLGKSLADRILFADHVKAEALALNAPGDFSARTCDLVYIRPAVTVAPKAIRSI